MIRVFPAPCCITTDVFHCNRFHHQLFLNSQWPDINRKVPELCRSISRQIVHWPTLIRDTFFDLIKQRPSYFFMFAGVHPVALPTRRDLSMILVAWSMRLTLPNVYSKLIVGDVTYKIWTSQKRIHLTSKIFEKKQGPKFSGSPELVPEFEYFRPVLNPQVPLYTLPFAEAPGEFVGQLDYFHCRVLHMSHTPAGIRSLLPPPLRNCCCDVECQPSNHGTQQP